MSEHQTVAATKTPNTVSTMTQDLVNLGIQEGDVLLVHSSLSSIGWVCGGPQAVILALKAAVTTNGTLVMPAHSGDWSDPADWSNPPVPTEWFQTIYDTMPAFDPERTPVRGIGRIPELFRTDPDTHRSIHPQVSFCASGALADRIVSSHPLTPQFGMESPLGELYRLQAKVLLLGAGFDSCTSFHLAEVLHPAMPRKKMGTAMIHNGERIWCWFEDYDYDSDDFSIIGEEMETMGLIRSGVVGQADCKLFDLKMGVDFAQDWMKSNRVS